MFHSGHESKKQTCFLYCVSHKNVERIDHFVENTANFRLSDMNGKRISPDNQQNEYVTHLRIWICKITHELINVFFSNPC
jgi:hypothetical protein